MSGWIT